MIASEIQERRLRDGHLYNRLGTTVGRLKMEGTAGVFRVPGRADVLGLVEGSMRS